MAALPRTLAVLTLSACGGPQVCMPELLPNAPVRTFHCADGRSCGEPLPPLEDGGYGNNFYQLCPSADPHCDRLGVRYDGRTDVTWC